MASARAGAGAATGGAEDFLARLGLEHAAGKDPAAQRLERRGRLPIGKPQPLHGEELLGYPGARLIRAVDHHRQEKEVIVRHVERALDRQTPFAAEVTLVPRLGPRRHDGHEVVALADLAADFLIPCIAAAEFALVEPYFETEARQCIAERACGLAVIRGIAEKYRCRHVRARRAIARSRAI